MEFRAKYGINCGVASMGLKGPDYVEEEIKVNAESDEKAYIKFFIEGKNLARKYFSDPNLGYTKVKILDITDENFNSINQKELVSKLLPDVDSDNFEEDKTVITDFMIEKLIRLK